MLINLNDYELIKAIKRSEAKAVHKELPPGGVWRTIKGHHIYIKDGKVLAGAIPGVTKAKKATKKQLAEHQANLDKGAKKGTSKGEKSESTDSSKTKRPKTQRPGDSKKATGKAGAKPKTKASGSKQKGGEVDEKVSTKPKAPAKGVQRSSKPKSDGRTVKPATAKPKSEKSGSKAPAKKTSQAEKQLRSLAGNADDGMEMWMMATENADTMKVLKDAMKTAEGASTKEKLAHLYKKYGGGDKPEYAPDSTKKMDDFSPGKAKVRASEVSISVRTDGRNALASAPTGSGITIHEDFKSNDRDTQRYVIAHETGHILSNAYPGLASHILDNPEGALGRVNNKRGRFEGVGGTMTPEESWADAYSHYHTDPDWLKAKHPKAYKFVEKVLSKIPGHKKYLDKAFEELDRVSGNTAGEHYEVFHGTRLYYVEDIKRDGFKLNGNSEDFGHASYFKSPALDHLDDQEFTKHNEERAKRNMSPLRKNEYNTENVVKYFSGYSNDSAVIKATIPKEHVLDCTKGRPKELTNIIKSYYKAGGDYADIIKLMAKNILKRTPSDEELESYESPIIKELEKAWGRRINVGGVSPYEIYAKAHGVKAIVDKLDRFSNEGWQIGVYDPSIIQVKDHGWGIQTTDEGVALMKALMKAMEKAGDAYCLLGFEMTEDGLHLHVGALKNKKSDQIEKSLSAFQDFVMGWKGEWL